MMRQKKSKAQKELKVEINADLQKSAKQLDLRSQFKALEPMDQEAVINFFNLHNAAIWLYSHLTGPAKDYTDFAIQLSQELSQEEEKEKV